MSVHEVDTAGIGGKKALLPGEILAVFFGQEVSQSHSIPVLPEEGLNINLPEIESGVVATLRIAFQ